jgi:preprotein translocase subunit YajC
MDMLGQIEQLANFFIPNAYADVTGAVPPPAQGSGFSFILMLVIIFTFAYLLIWRPQSKRARAQQNLLGSLAKGDEVVTVGGILGRVTQVANQYLVVHITDNVEIVVQKSSIVNVLPKGTLKSLHG